MLIVVVDHDVFRLEVAMDDAVGVDIVKRFENAYRDMDGAVLGNTPFIHDLTQQPAVAPLHDHVDAGMFFVAEDAHDLGVVELFTDARFAMEAIGEDGIGFHVGVRDFESDGAVIAHVGGAID